MPVTQDSILHVKEVEVPTTKDRKRKRPPFSYPLEYSTTQVDFTIWDLTFLMQFTHGLTIHQFDTPPRRVLDLGCGCGFWAITYARQHPEAIVIGIDIKDVQPRLEDFPSLKDVAGRVHWVHADMLDPLNFPDEHFDMVRASYLNMSVPEYEWQFFLEEIYRVLKPSGVFELLEEDLIFPGGPSAEISPPNSASYLPDLTFASNAANYSLDSRENSWSFDAPASTRSQRDHNHYSYDQGPEVTDATSSQHSFQSDHFMNTTTTKTSQNSSFTSHHLTSPLDTSVSARLSMTGAHVDLELDDYDGRRPDGVADPLDHSKLKAAWQEMLGARWLTVQPTNVLPLYLSTIFEEYRAMPVMEIRVPRGGTVQVATEPELPWASGARRKSFGKTPLSRGESQTRRSSGQRVEERDHTHLTFSRFGQKIDPIPYRTLHRATVKDEPLASTSATSSASSLPQASNFVWSWSPMHLERMVQITKGCKEAIWESYEKLYGKGPVITPVFGLTADKAKKNTARDEFETAWMNWENDMAARVEMRGIIESSLQWPIPPGDPPDWRVWRDRVRAEPTMSVGLGDGSRPSFSGSGGAAYASGDVCRCIRGFVAWKDPSHRQVAPILNGS